MSRRCGDYHVNLGAGPATRNCDTDKPTRDPSGELQRSSVFTAALLTFHVRRFAERATSAPGRLPQTQIVRIAHPASAGPFAAFVVSLAPGAGFRDFHNVGWGERSATVAPSAVSPVPSKQGDPAC